MKKNPIYFLFLLLFLVLDDGVFAQAIDNQKSGDLVLLTIRTGILIKTKATIEFNNSEEKIEYDAIVKEKLRNLSKLELQNKMVLESFKFLLDKGFECISSN